MIPLLQLLLNKLLFNPNKHSIGGATRIIKQKAEADEIYSPSSAYVLKRAAKDLKKNNPVEWDLARNGEMFVKNNILKPVRRDYSKLNVGDLWVTDGKKLDYDIEYPFTVKACRYTAIFIMDAASRYIVGAYIGKSENKEKK